MCQGPGCADEEGSAARACCGAAAALQEAAELQGRLEAALQLDAQLSAARAVLDYLWCCEGGQQGVEEEGQEEGQEEEGWRVKEQELVFEYRGCSITVIAMYSGMNVVVA